LILVLHDRRQLVSLDRTATHCFQSNWESIKRGVPRGSVLGRMLFNHLTSNGHYLCRPAQLTSRCCILYIYSRNIRIEYFKNSA